MRRYLGQILGLSLFFALYTLLWVHYFFPQKINKSRIRVQESGQNEQTNVLSVVSKPAEIPAQYKMNITPRKQAFNLSCEFAAASSILFAYTKDQQFGVQNEQQAEELLMKKAGVSQNPNLGIRMGEVSSFEQLLQNMNQKFGGTAYYGAHAPVFIDVFADHGLGSRLIVNSNQLLDELKKAISSGHFVMAWIKLGQGKPVDASLTYGFTPLIKGEHTVVLYGYDQRSLLVMDPGSGALRSIPTNDFLSAASDFALPFLEVYPNSRKQSLESLVSLDKPIGLSRNKLSVQVYNSSKEIGKGSEIAAILKDFGYHVISLSDVRGENQDVTITIKKNFDDYLFLLKKDLNAASYEVASISSELFASSSAEAIVTVGE